MIIYLFTYLLHNGPVTFFFEQAEIIWDGSIAKASLNNKKRIVQKKRPETKWSMHEQAEIYPNRLWRAELTSVAKDGDDLCIGVKG